MICKTPDGCCRKGEVQVLLSGLEKLIALSRRYFLDVELHCSGVGKGGEKCGP